MIPPSLPVPLAPPVDPGGNPNVPVPPAPPVGMPPGPMPGPGAGMPVPGGGYPMPPNPASIQYGTQTQADGTVLIYMQNPDGTPGPVIHVFKPPHLKGGGKK